jgi:hypothetical protein
VFQIEVPALLAGLQASHNLTFPTSFAAVDDQRFHNSNSEIVAIDPNARLFFAHRRRSSDRCGYFLTLMM